MTDKINHPAHYTQGKIEVWDFIVDQKMDYLRGCALKYICRAPYKDNYVEDLEKAINYLNKAIETHKEEQKPKFVSVALKPVKLPPVMHSPQQDEEEKKDWEPWTDDGKEKSDIA